MTAKRPIGDSGIEMTPLALGGNVFAWTADQAASFRVLDAFTDAGGMMVDTADVYSSWLAGHRGGESETVIGNWLRRDRSKRERLVIATKVGMLTGLTPAQIRTACEASLKRLRVDAIDLYYQHQDDPKVPLEDSLGAFDALHRAGKIRAVGLSNFKASRVEEALSVCRRNGFVAPAALQDRFNLVERDDFEGPLQDVAVSEGLSEFPYYSLANGFLTGKYRSEADFGKSVRGGRAKEFLENPHGRAVLAALDDVAAETGAPLAAISLAWLKAQPGVTAPIASATSVEQVAELNIALTLNLAPAQLERLSAASG